MLSCDICDQEFCSEWNLKRHSATHDALAKPHTCTKCAFGSTRKDSLKRHYELYHQQMCGDGFETGMALNSANNSNNFHASNQLTLNSADYFNMSSSFDKRLQLPHNFIYAGASQSGKTTLLMKTLENASNIYNPVPTRVFFLYSCFQQNYTTVKQQLSAQGIECIFHQASVVTEHDLEAIADPNGGQTLIIIDDNSIAAASSKELAQVFTIARHKNCSVVLLLHFIFGPWPSSRIISGNTSYFFLLKSPRMKKQIASLGAQLGRQNALLSAYDRESSKKYGYVLLDLCTETPEHLRLRSDIFNENGCNGRGESNGTIGNTAPNVNHKSTQTEVADESTHENHDASSTKVKKKKFVFVPWNSK